MTPTLVSNKESFQLEHKTHIASCTLECRRDIIYTYKT